MLILLLLRGCSRNECVLLHLVVDCVIVKASSAQKRCPFISVLVVVTEYPATGTGTYAGKFNSYCP